MVSTRRAAAERARAAAMAFSTLSGDEQGVILGQLRNALEPRLVMYFSSASKELRALLPPAAQQQLRADYEEATALWACGIARSCATRGRSNGTTRASALCSRPGDAGHVKLGVAIARGAETRRSLGLSCEVAPTACSGGVQWASGWLTTGVYTDLEIDRPLHEPQPPRPPWPPAPPPLLYT